MALPRREHGVSGPHRPDSGDVGALNSVFADSFTDRYRRDGLVGVRVPRLNPAIWDYAMQDAGDGAMVWRDETGAIVAFNIAHRSGAEGWMGPLAVRPDRQGSGIGTAIVRTAADWLREHQSTTIGLETMPRTVDNIGFYSQLGFVPQHLTVTMVGDARPRAVSDVTWLSGIGSSDRDALLDAMRDRLDQSAPGCDYTREFQLTLEMGVGEGAVVESCGVRGFALWHTAGLVESRPPEELRLLKLFADSRETFEKLVAVLEASAADAGLDRVAVRCQTACADAYGALVHLGYRVRWTDLRMTLNGYPEARLGEREVLFSNWEV
jgi:GNAT superfamily N-acetyltransferase